MTSAIVHGTYDGYNNHSCRCDECKAAATEYRKSLLTLCPNGCGNLVFGRYKPDRVCRACTIEKLRKPLEHGTEVGYCKGCRCAPCRAASAAARRDRRARTGR